MCVFVWCGKDVDLLATRPRVVAVMMRPMTALLAPIKVCGDTGDRDLYRPIMYLQSGMFACLIYIHKNRAILACISFSFALASQPWISKWQKEKTFWGYQIYMSVFEHHPLSFNRRNCSSHFDRMSLSPDIPDIYDFLAYEQDLTLNGCLCSRIQSPASEDWKLPQALGPH